MTTALRSLAVTAGEVPESEWRLGWHDPPAVRTAGEADRAGTDNAALD